MIMVLASGDCGLVMVMLTVQMVLMKQKKHAERKDALQLNLGASMEDALTR